MSSSAALGETQRIGGKTSGREPAANRHSGSLLQSAVNWKAAVQKGEGWEGPLNGYIVAIMKEKIEKKNRFSVNLPWLFRPTFYP